jgi:predicted transporter
MIIMWEILWQMGILAAILVFAFKIGMAMGFANLSKKVAAGIAIGYGLGILILTRVAAEYTDYLYTLMYDYNSVIFLIMGVVILYAGWHTVKEWKIHQKNHASATCMAMIAPCPCCFGAVLAVIILMSPVIGASSFVIGQYSAVALSVLIGVFYLFSNTIVRFIKQPFPLVLGNFMMFMGFYFLASAIVIPNIATVLSSEMSPMTIPSITTIVYAILGVVILLVSGFYINKKTSTLLQ